MSVHLTDTEGVVVERTALNHISIHLHLDAVADPGLVGEQTGNHEPQALREKGKQARVVRQEIACRVLANRRRE
jgi:hypothetical protein